MITLVSCFLQKMGMKYHEEHFGSMRDILKSAQKPRKILQLLMNASIGIGTGNTWT